MVEVLGADDEPGSDEAPPAPQPVEEPSGGPPGPPPSEPFDPGVAKSPFLQLHAPNGQTWANYCGPVPPALDSRGHLTGAWAEVMYASVVFELTHPGWNDLPEYQDNGPAGYVIEYLQACGYGKHSAALEASEVHWQEYLREPVEGSKAFLRHKARNGQTWEKYLGKSKVSLDSDGFVNGAWGECITAACIFEHENPAWNELAAFSQDGPVGQVLNYLMQCGHGEHEGAACKTEEATHAAIREGNKIPVFDSSFYQASVGVEPADVIDEPPPEPTGRKKALLVGCNYPGSEAQLNGCINDTGRWWNVLKTIYDFKEEDLLLLRDQGEQDWRKTSTRDNMINGVRWLVDGAAPGDVLFFQFSGHGGQRQCHDSSEADGKDELLIPSDYQSNGVILDHELFDLMVVPLQSGVKLTVMLDCCHSGSALDLPFVWSEESNNWEEDENPWHTAGDVQMFSGCEDAQCSMDVMSHGKAAGAMTTAMCDVLEDLDKKKESIEYPHLLVDLKAVLAKRGYDQRPKLSSSQPFSGEHKQFTLAEGHVSNLNKTLGCKAHGGKPPRKNATGFAW